MVSMLIEIYVYLVRYEIHMHMYVLPVLLDPVSAFNQFKGGPVLSGPVLVLEFPEDFRTGPVLVLSKIDPRTRPDRTLKH